MDITKVLQSQVVTEKSTNLQKDRKYVFMVSLQATKVDIKNAVESAYGVKVTDVSIMPVLKKIRRAGRSRVITKRHQGKKAVITLAPKNTLDVNKVKA